VVLAACTKHGCALRYADDVLKSDKRVVLAAVRSDGWALKYADDVLKSDKAVVLAAVKSNGHYSHGLLTASNQIKTCSAPLLEMMAFHCMFIGDGIHSWTLREP